MNEGSDVHLIIRTKTNTELFEKIKTKITLHVHDGTADHLFNIVKIVKPDFVVHLAAAFVKHDDRFNNIDEIVKSNILFGSQLVHSMVMNNVKFLLNTGTSWQHYNNQNYNPICLYSASKQAYIDMLKYYVEANNLKVITLKLFHTYGPYDNRNKLFCQLRNSINNKTTIKMTPGKQKVDIVYIDDVVEAYLIASKRLISKESKQMEQFSISSGQHIALKTLIGKYYKIKNVEENIIWGGKNYRPREEMIPFTNGKILPKWKPKISIEDGIRKMEGL